MGKLKLEALLPHKTWGPIKPDLDNIAKFVLDSVKGILCVDGKQIVNLTMHKMRDSQGLCLGRVGIQMAPCRGTPETFMPDF